MDKGCAKTHVELGLGTTEKADTMDMDAGGKLLISYLGMIISYVV